MCVRVCVKLWHSAAQHNKSSSYVEQFTVFPQLSIAPLLGYWNTETGDVSLIKGSGHNTQMVCSIAATQDNLFSLGLDKALRRSTTSSFEYTSVYIIIIIIIIIINAVSWWNETPKFIADCFYQWHVKSLFFYTITDF